MFLAGVLQRVASARAEAADWGAASEAFEEALGFDDKDVQLRLQYASVLFALRRFERAEVVARSAVALEPANAQAQLALARTLLEEGKQEEAKALVDKAFAQGQPLDVWGSVVSSYLKRMQIESARELLARMIATFGDAPEVHFAAGLAYYYGDHPVEGVGEFRRAIAQNNVTPDFHYYLGLALLGNDEEAGHAEAVREFRAELKINSDDYRCHHMLGYLALGQRDFAEAEAELSRAVALNPQYPASMMYLGEVYQETKRDAEGERALRQAIALSGNSTDNVAIRAHYMLGRLLQKSGRTQEATDELKKSEQLRRERAADKKIPPVIPAQQEKANAYVAQVSPTIGAAYGNLGGIAARSGDFANASSYFERAAAWSPALKVAGHLALAEAYASRGQLDSALHEGHEVIALDPKQERAHLILGVVLLGKHQANEAEKEFRAALQLNPADTAAMYLLSLSLIDMRQREEAVGLLLKVVERQPNNADALYLLGRLQLDGGDPKGAITNLEAAAKLKPENAPIHSELARAYRGDSRMADAEKEEKLYQGLQKQ